MLFRLGDYLAGITVGVLTALAVRAIVGHDMAMDMVVAMLLGMLVGMVVHFLVGLVSAPLIGMFHSMLPGSLIGMYGGMFFAMRDSMQAGSVSWGATATVGAAFGAVTVLAIHLYDLALRGVVFDADGE